MPARSKSQQRLFGMVHAYQKGKLEDAPERIKDIAAHISEEDAEHFAKTKHKKLPEKKAEAHHPDFKDIVQAYKDRFGIDLSHVKMKWSKHPRYSNGKVDKDMPDDMSGGCHGPGIVWMNPNPREVMKRYGVDGKVKDFRRWIMAHELAHEIDSALNKRKFINKILEEAKKVNYHSSYLDTVPAHKFDKELFAEYMAKKLSEPTEKKASAADLKELARLIETLSRLRGSAKYLTVPGLKLRGADIDAAARLFGARRADPAKYAVWLNRVLNNGARTPDLLIDKGIPLLHNPKFIIDRLSRTGWTASPEALRRAGVMQVNAAPFFSLDGGAFVATPSEVQAFKNGLFPFRSMYGKSVIGRDVMGRPIYAPWRISNHVNTVVPVRESIGASKTGRYYDILRDAEANVDPRLLTGHQVSRGSFDLFVPRGQEAGIRFDWQEPYGTTGFYGGPKLGGLGDWGGIPRGSELIKHSEVNCNIGDNMTMLNKIAAIATAAMAAAPAPTVQPGAARPVAKPVAKPTVKPATKPVKPVASFPTSGPVGYRNHNPGNLRSDGATKWRGATGVPAKGSWLQFKTWQDGIRAMARTLYNYGKLHGVDTVEGVLKRYDKSPDQTEYLAHVRNKMNLKPGQTINLTDVNTLHKLVPAMGSFEIGPVYWGKYNASSVSNAVQRAVPPATKK